MTYIGIEAMPSVAAILENDVRAYFRLLMAVLLKHLDLGHVASHIVEYGLSESGTRLGLPRSIANVCKAVYETKRALIKVSLVLHLAFNYHHWIIFL